MNNNEKKKLPVILIAFKEGGENGGPYTSHKRILENCISSQYCLKPFVFPRSRVLFSPKGMRKLVKSIKNENAVAMHIVGLQLEGFVAMIACKLAGIKVLLAIHGSGLEACKINKLWKVVIAFLEKSTVKHADIVYGVSDYVTSWPVCKYAKKMIGTIYNIPSNSMVQKNNGQALRQELGIKDTDIVVVSTGRIIADKGYDILLQVIRKFKNVKDIVFVIAGDGEYRKYMEQAVINEDMAENVFLLGYRTDIDNILNMADIFIICTKHETLCISLQEAGIHGLPLIATRVGGIPEIVDSTCGILVDNLDVRGFVTAINRLKNDGELRKEYGNNARRKILSKFSEEKIIKQLDQVYLELIENK